ncbi:large conductance mechanosensitive channel protein MscL [Aneurinibacillus terranovensis]|uniref:large conductance mechanosensitive channel protein MscL n=1 Tax=Aneurinibacillus terranovensis TaxID=278991 RepID=UPI0003F952E0|nr:large conductance mechanosensitive channel protein MscL [Aneurinibacillus terranovensis]
MKFIDDFKKFISKGNVVNLAVGVAMGAAFNNIVTSLVNDIIMPPLGKVLSGVDFSELFINLSSHKYATLADAKKAGVATINYGLFLNNVLRFLIIALTLFFIVRAYTRLVELAEFRDKAAKEAKNPDKKECPFCLSDVLFNASRCPACTSFFETGESKK